MPAPDPAVLEREAHVFGRYLLGAPPGEYVLRKYNEAHRALAALGEAGAFDSFLVSFAGAGPFYTKLADSYARVFAPRAALRRKLIVLLAILESCAPSYRALDAPDAAGAAIILAKMAARGLGFAASALLGALLLGPFHLTLGLRRGAR